MSFSQKNCNKNVLHHRVSYTKNYQKREKLKVGKKINEINVINKILKSIDDIKKCIDLWGRFSQKRVE